MISLEQGIQIHLIALISVVCLLSYSDIKKKKKIIPRPAMVGCPLLSLGPKLICWIDPPVPSQPPQQLDTRCPLMWCSQ